MLNLNLKRSVKDLYGLLEKTKDEVALRWLKKNFRNLLKAELYEAEKKARVGGKRKTYNTHGVELRLDENIERLTAQLMACSYKPSRGIASIIFTTVNREIFAAPYIDRIVHHFVVDTIYPWWDRRFLPGASSCRVGKGTSYGVKLLDKHIRRASGNFAKPVYVIKMDISGYFIHIVREQLKKRVLWGLHEQFKGHYGLRYRIVKNALTAIIMDDPIDGVKIHGSYSDWRAMPDNKSMFMAEDGTGIVIGNVSSQVFSNIYLDVLDRFVTQNLKYKYYGRYVDDFYIVVTEEQLEQAKLDIEVIDNFLLGLGLTLNRKKTATIPAWQGVPFLGMVVKNGVIMPGKRIVKNYNKAVREYLAGANNEASVASYIGMMKNYDAYKVIIKPFKGNEELLNKFLK